MHKREPGLACAVGDRAVRDHPTVACDPASAQGGAHLRARQFDRAGHVVYAPVLLGGA